MLFTRKVRLAGKVWQYKAEGKTEKPKTRHLIQLSLRNNIFGRKGWGENLKNSVPARVLAGDKKMSKPWFMRVQSQIPAQKIFSPNGGCTCVIVIATVGSLISKAQKMKEIPSLKSLSITELSAGYVLPSSGNYLHSLTLSLG